MYHKGNVVAGEALVKVVNMEKEASVPKIEVSEEVLNLKSDQGNLIFTDHFQEYCITERDGTKIFGTYAFHNGVWRDYVAKNDIESIEHAECLNIAESLLSKVNSISNKHRDANNEKAAEKWEWFESYFRDSLNSGIWQEIRTKNK